MFKRYFEGNNATLSPMQINVMSYALKGKRMSDQLDMVVDEIRATKDKKANCWRNVHIICSEIKENVDAVPIYETRTITLSPPEWVG